MSVYEISTLGAQDNKVTFNDPSIDPYFRVQQRLPQKYQIRQQDIPVPFQSGISDFITLIGDTVYVIKGRMYPSGEAAYDTGRNILASVSSLDLEQTDPYSSDEGYVPYVWGDASSATNSKQLFVKVLYAILPEDTRQGYAQPFTIYCKIKDPTIYGYTQKTASTASANPSSTVGSFVLPTTLPAPIGVTTYNISTNAYNAGTIGSYPQTINIYGPVTNPVLTNSSTGEYFGVNVTLSSSSDVLNITYSKDVYTVTKNGVSVVNLVQAGSTTFQIHPGNNVLTLSGSLGNGAYASVQYYDAYPLA